MGWFYSAMPMPKITKRVLLAFVGIVVLLIVGVLAFLVLFPKSAKLIMNPPSQNNTLGSMPRANVTDEQQADIGQATSSTPRKN